MKYLRSHLVQFLIIAAISALITRNIWSTRAWIETHDGVFHVIRTIQMKNIILQGEFPARWAGDLDNGFGLPLFTFVYPGPYLIALPLMLMGWGAKWSIKLITCLFFVIGGLGIYALFQKKGKGFAGAAAVLYLTAPYLLVNVFVRGALGETMAMALLPWVLVSVLDLSSTHKIRWYHPLPYALLLLAHNFLSFVFLPIFIAAGYIYRCPSKLAIKSFLLSFGLSAFFVMPMLGERGYIASFANSNFTYPYSDHFVYPYQLISGKWGNGASLPGVGDGMSFQLGYILSILALIGVIIAINTQKRNLIIWSVLLLGTVFMMLPVSNFIWKIMTPLQAIQFPWRFLSFTPLLILCLTGEFFVYKQKQWPLWVGAGISLMFAIRYSTPPYLQNNEQYESQIFMYGEKTTTSSRQELLPRWVKGQERWVGQEPVRIIKGQANISVSQVTSTSLTINSQTDNPDTQYEIRRNYFPSWSIYNEQGKKIPYSPTPTGEILLEPELGSHVYKAIIGQTFLEKLANTISIIIVLFIIGYEFKTSKFFNKSYP